MREKFKLLSGKNYWETESCGEIQSLRMSDGPHGLRLGGVKTRAYPNNCAIACSWNREVASKMGESIASECVQNGVDVLLGPCANNKRTPLCGRNFEYYSEDPLLTGKLAASFITALQKNGTAACVKHFCANNSETNRFTYNACIREQVLRDFYLRSFEIAVKEGNPKTLMTAYNRVNGDYPGQSVHLLREILREEWGYEGVTISDWGAVDERSKSLEASLDLEMPSSSGVTDRIVEQDVLSGRVKERYLNETVDRMAELSKFCRDPERKKIPCQAADLRELASECVVLLKNEAQILPVGAQTKLAVFGEQAVRPHTCGRGSSRVEAELLSPLDELKKYCNDVVYCETGFEITRQALESAAAAEVCIVFAGTPDDEEAEGYDRKKLELEESFGNFLQELGNVNGKVAVVLFGGGAIETHSWDKHCMAVVSAHFLGESAGGAVADVLTGRVSPSGRLAETYPVKLSDTPAYVYSENYDGNIVYSEGMFVGYRYYTSKNIPTAYPFGYGLSYTAFNYSNFKLSAQDTSSEDERLFAYVTVQNIGRRDGSEVVQIYFSQPDKSRPKTVLCGFDKVFLKAGERRDLTVELDVRLLGSYMESKGGHRLISGEYAVSVNSDCTRPLLSLPLQVSARQRLECRRNTTIGELIDSKIPETILQKCLRKPCSISLRGADHLEFEFHNLEKTLSYVEINMLRSYPLRAFISLTNGAFDGTWLQQTLEELQNAANKPL